MKIKKYDEIFIGEQEQFVAVISDEMVKSYANLLGDTNPVHIDEDYAAKTFFRKRIAHGMLVAGLISTILGTKLPGPGAIYLEQNVEFKKPVYLNDTLTARVEVLEKDDKQKKITFRTWIENQDGQLVLDGHARVLHRQ